MKICMLTRAYTTNSSGGMEDYTQKLCEGLVTKGHEVSLITSRHQDNISSEILNGVKIYYINNPSPLSYKGFFLKAIKKFKELHQQVKFDVLHSQSSAALASIVFKIDIPLVITMHGSLTTETQLNPNIFAKKKVIEKISIILKLYKRIVIHFLTKVLLLKSNTIIVASDFSKKRFLNNKLSDKMQVIYHGINEELLMKVEKKKARSNLGIANDKKVLLCLGRLVEEKGIQILFNAFEFMKKEEYLLLIVGKGPYEEKLKEIVKEKKLDNIEFVGFVEDSKKYLYYNATDLFIYPELTSPAFGLVAAEAMACGTIVFSSDHEATREVIGNEGYLFPPSDHKKLAELITNYFELSDEEIKKMQRHFFDRQRKLFSYERMINDTENIYKKNCIEGSVWR